MNGWAWIILTGVWLGALAAAVSGLGLMGWAVLGRRRGEGVLTWARTGVPNTAEVEAACWGTDEVQSPRRARRDRRDCEPHGLESGHCPECGRSRQTDSSPRRERLRDRALHPRRSVRA